MLENFPQKLEGKKGALENFVENQWKICGKSVERLWKIFHTTYLLNLENFQILWKVVENFCGKFSTSHIIKLENFPPPVENFQHFVENVLPPLSILSN